MEGERGRIQTFGLKTRMKPSVVTPQTNLELLV